MELPGDFWAAQLTALSTKEELEKYATDRGLKGLSGAKVASNGRILYVLLLGVYENKALAEEAIEAFDLTPEQPEIWLRSMRSLQRAMREADALPDQDS